MSAMGGTASRRETKACLLLGSLLAIAACEQQQAAAPEAPPPAVTVAEVVRMEVSPSMEFVGRVEAIDHVDLRARVQGFLEQRRFEEGARVERGDLLFVIEKAPFQAAVDRTEAAVAQAKATLAEATATADRMREAIKTAAVSQQDLDQAVANEQAAEAEVLVKQAELRTTQLDLGYTDVFSPIDGRIGRATYTVGNLVGPSSDILATIVSLDPTYVTIPVSQRIIQEYQGDREREKQGRASILKVELADGTVYEHPGKIDFADITVSESTDTLTIRAQFPNPDGFLIDGQFVTVIVEEPQTEDSLVIPLVAVQTDQAGRFVLVVDSEDKVEVRRIEPGSSTETEMVVESGLQEGERVIVQGVQKVRPGQVVEPSAATGSLGA